MGGGGLKVLLKGTLAATVGGVVDPLATWTMKPDGINPGHPSGDTGGFITHFITHASITRIENVKSKQELLPGERGD